MKMYITKYALSDGVEHVECEPGDAEGWVVPSGHSWSLLVGRDAHATIEAAQARFNEMVADKVKSLEKQLAKLRALKFEVKP